MEGARALGWQSQDYGSWRPQGPCVGWWADDGIYLDPDASYTAAQQLGSSGDGIGIALPTLHRRMHERRLLRTTERRDGELRFKVRKSTGGRRRGVLHVSHGLTPFASGSGPTGPVGPHDENAQHNADVA
jgi:hypothetical protein